jgi:hypothetical protein
MSKRKNRTSKPKPKPQDLLKPFDITKFGSEEDPCFGKLYKASAPECTICGDSIICAIAMQQTQTAKRELEEKTGSFKDMEEVESFEFDLKAVEKKILTRLIKTDKPLKASLVIRSIHNRYKHMAGCNKEGAKAAVIKVVKQSTRLSSYSKNKIRYIKLK